MRSIRPVRPYRLHAMVALLGLAVTLVVVGYGIRERRYPEGTLSCGGVPPAAAPLRSGSPPRSVARTGSPLASWRAAGPIAHGPLRITDEHLSPGVPCLGQPFALAGRVVNISGQPIHAVNVSFMGAGPGAVQVQSIWPTPQAWLDFAPHGWIRVRVLLRAVRLGPSWLAVGYSSPTVGMGHGAIVYYRVAP